MRTETLAEALGIAPANLSPLTPLAPVEPARPSVFSFCARGTKYVIKFCEKGNVRSTESLNWETQVLQFLESSGSTPSPVIRVADEIHHGFLVPYIESDATIHPGDDAVLTAVAACLSRLHAVSWRVPYPPGGIELPVLFGGHFFWIGGKQIIRDKIERVSNLVMKDAVLQALDLLDASRRRLVEPFRSQAMVIIHGDITFGNMVFCDRADRIEVKLIDFGEAAIGPPQLDLARYSITHGLTPRQEMFLLKNYCAMAELCGCKTEENEIFLRRFAGAKVLAIFDIFISGPIMLGDQPDERAAPSVLSGLKRLKHAIDNF